MVVSQEEARETLLNVKLSEILHAEGLKSRSLQGIKTTQETQGEADLVADLGGLLRGGGVRSRRQSRRRDHGR